jgi:hypothetical protein
VEPAVDRKHRTADEDECGQAEADTLRDTVARLRIVQHQVLDVPFGNPGSHDRSSPKPFVDREIGRLVGLGGQGLSSWATNAKKETTPTVMTDAQRMMTPSASSASRTSFHTKRPNTSVGW